MIKILHSADLHFSNKANKLEEVITVTDFLLERATVEQPDVTVLAGDLVDEHDGPIRVDSAAARAAIRVVTALADISPVVIVRGTRSHDRETPYIFRELRAKYPIYVSSQVEMVALLSDNRFVPVGEGDEDDYKAVFTLLPSPDKANFVATFGGESVQASTMIAKEVLNDALSYIGSVNEELPLHVPRILVAHGMITGAQFSSGTIATGEDLEFTTADLALTNTDIKLFGHVHKFQTFPGNIFYSGSPGRLNMGETEIKGFLVHSMDDRFLEETRFIETPAKTFVLYDVQWGDEGVERILEEAEKCEAECFGAEVRFRFTIPEELRHMINRDELSARFTSAGAKLVKIEMSCILESRQRSPGISKLITTSDKMCKWADTKKIELPARVLTITDTIKGRDVEELIEDAKRAIYGVPIAIKAVEVQQAKPVLTPPQVADNWQESLFG